jgi:soluble lytic murein transglycosylase-like protein
MRDLWLSGMALTLLAGSSAARADIYSFVDSSGVAHFSNVPTDKRYRLVLAIPPSSAAESAASVEKWLEKSVEYDGMIERAAHSATVQADLVRAVIVVESAFNPRAVSSKGALGLMQLQPATARRFGVSNAFDPEQNIAAGARYLSELIARYDNSIELALAAYNAGEEAVERYGRHIPPFGETKRYVPNVIRVYEALRAQGRTS